MHLTKITHGLMYKEKYNMIIKCACESEFQDSKYGKGNRVHNETMKGAYRCTICGQTKQVGATEKKKKEKA